MREIGVEFCFLLSLFYRMDFDAFVVIKYVVCVSMKYAVCKFVKMECCFNIVFLLFLLSLSAECMIQLHRPTVLLTITDP